MHPVLKVAGVVHIWYYIPLCTIFARNSMVTLAGLNFIFPNEIPKSNAHFEEGFFNSSVSQSMAAIRRLFTDPNLLALKKLGWKFIQDYSQWLFLEVLSHFNQLSRHQVFQYSLDNSIGPYRRQFNQPVCSCPNWANSISQFNFKMAKTIFSQFRKYSQ
ncbi:hypothetical protein O181_016397 [Austropuccinia psidii MF-1]|uniref:Uncharacterized protein n=1 Tax=Austropuccinia psidii MF-1 TaxID=1389203 RepID=A0A9Q3GRM6_9BASI|nr:hypothetical protein [Austropuccinia psidii MF-1]